MLKWQGVERRIQLMPLWQWLEKEHDAGNEPLY
jgi:hypothetical protein